MQRFSSTRFLLTVLGCALIAAVSAPSLFAQNNNNNNNNNNNGNNQSVGGILISVDGIAIAGDGVLSSSTAADIRVLRDAVLKGLGKAPAELAAHADLRKISLKRIEAALAIAQRDGLETLPEEVRYLAGMQRVEYVFADPEHNDIVIAGPGEGWKVNELGSVVGVTTGLPVCRLDDFMVALRSSEAARKGGITCSIDPTPEGLKNFAKAMSTTGRRMHAGLDQELSAAMGPQTITIVGVSDKSHFARVLVAADYKMKRYAMELDPLPIKGIPTFTSLLKANPKAAADNAIPRWWLACDYEPLRKTADGLGYELRGPGVKAMTESDFIDAEGASKRSGKASAVAQKFATAFTEKYGELCRHDSVFGELRNIMDMSVIAAIIQREDMAGRSGLQAPLLFTARDAYPLEGLNAPKTVSTKCTITKNVGGWLVLASGGVEISSWKVAERAEDDAALNGVREKSVAAQGSKVWWD